MLRQRGALADMAYDHGRLLAREVETGVFPEILSSIARGVDFGDPVKSAAGRLLFRAIGSQVFEHVSTQFAAAVGALGEGYRDGLAKPRFSEEDVRDALLAIEIQDVAEGLAHLLTVGNLARCAEAVADIVALCLAETPAPSVRALFETAGHELLRDLASRLAHPTNRAAFGCTGLSVPGSATSDGRHLHGRNLDADLYAWNEAPTVFVTDETPAGARHRYVAFGTAGLIYPGGISGINDAGIGVSLHQLSTVQYRLHYDAGRACLAPFLQQMVLRDAGTLDEAADIINAAQNVSAWVILCSDAKTGQTIRVEFNGRVTRVGDRRDGATSQTNHFLHPDLVEHLFDADDAHYTPTLGKWLETRTRMTMVDAALDSGVTEMRIDTDWAIDVLSSGRDPELAGAASRAGLDLAADDVIRSFGRVPRKSYGQLMTIVRGDPGRAPGGDEAWMTFGDGRPGCDGSLVGWTIDWSKAELTPAAGGVLKRTRQYETAGRGHWEASFDRFLAARVAIVRPCDDAGDVIDRAATDAETDAAHRNAEALLSEAIALAEQDRIVEVPYHYVRARVRHQLGDYAAAAADWNLLLGLWTAQTAHPPQPVTSALGSLAIRPVLHEYEAALCLALSTVTEDARRGARDWPGRVDRLREASNLFEAIRGRLFDGRPAHPYLLGWIERAKTLAGPHPEQAKLPDIEFVTVE
ncbi:MAG: hypothetical protein JO326_08800 [Acetobacteraceae bacterium]|nr:hypothetical protein [Acetobacteraceae bacterium]